MSLETTCCDRPHYAKGLCRKHYTKERNKTLGPCIYTGCDRQAWCLRLCTGHYSQRRRGEDLHDLPPLRVQGGQGYVDSEGYRRIYRPQHFNTWAQGWVAEHRYVMELMLNRSLYPGENVHHKNGDRLDNRPKNLELWVTTQPKGQRPEDLVEWAREILERYA